ncbi:MAG: hypothetical protein HYX47_13355 [Burkholderiales bacterium]|nr:hypothetical protein [Burkholderiales bacterium]
MFKDSVRVVGLALVIWTAALTSHAQNSTPAASPASKPVAASSAASTPVNALLKAPEAQRGTIGTITDLAQQLKVEQLKRDLREAKQGNAAVDGAGFKLPPAGALPVIAALKVTPVRTELTPPAVVGILGVGARLRARLGDGQEVVVGQSVQGWSVTAITPAAVTFANCPAAKKGMPSEPCLSRSVSPSAV